MNLTISLDESLASQLRREASARQLAPEQVARDLLSNALDTMAGDEAWATANQRRTQLIRKNRQSGLTAEERTELEQLQAAADQQLETMDLHLLALARQFRQVAEELPDAITP